MQLPEHELGLVLWCVVGVGILTLVFVAGCS